MAANVSKENVHIGPGGQKGMLKREEHEVNVTHRAKLYETSPEEDGNLQKSYHQKETNRFRKNEAIQKSL